MKWLNQTTWMCFAGTDWEAFRAECAATFSRNCARYIQRFTPEKMKRTLRQAFDCHATALFAGRCNSISETGKEFRRVMQVGEWSLYITRVVKTKGSPRHACSYPAARTESLLELKGTLAKLLMPLVWSISPSADLR